MHSKIKAKQLHASEGICLHQIGDFAMVFVKKRIVQSIQFLKNRTARRLHTT